MGFRREGGNVHGVKNIQVHLIGRRSGQVGDAVVLPVSGRYGTALGAVDPEILRIPHFDVCLVDRDRQLDVDVVDGIIPGGTELVGHLDDRADLHILGGEGPPADIFRVLLVEVELLGHLRPDDFSVLPVESLHLDPGVSLLRAVAVEIQETEVTEPLALLLEDLDAFVDGDILDDHPGDFADDQVHRVFPVQHHGHRRGVGRVDSHVDFRIRDAAKLGIDRDGLGGRKERKGQGGDDEGRLFHIEFQLDTVFFTASGRRGRGRRFPCP